MGLFSKKDNFTRISPHLQAAAKIRGKELATIYSVSDLQLNDAGMDNWKKIHEQNISYFQQNGFSVSDAITASYISISEMSNNHKRNV